MANDFNIKPIDDFSTNSYGTYGDFSKMFDDVKYPQFDGDGMKVDYSQNGSYDFGDSTTGQDLWGDTKDFLGSKTFSNTVSTLGMGATAYMNYQKMENERKFNDKMFDLQEGQLLKDNARIENSQANYNASTGR